MSTPSKARRKRREWMHAFNNDMNLMAADYSRRVVEARKDERARLTQTIPRDDDGVFYPSGKITHPYIRIMARTEFDPVELYDPKRLDYLRYAHIEEFGLKAEQFALVLPDGTRVVCWGWKLA